MTRCRTRGARVWLGMLLAEVRRHPLQDAGGAGAQLAGIAVDQLELPFHPSEAVGDPLNEIRTLVTVVRSVPGASGLGPFPALRSSRTFTDRKRRTDPGGELRRAAEIQGAVAPEIARNPRRVPAGRLRSLETCSVIMLATSFGGRKPEGRGAIRDDSHVERPVRLSRPRTSSMLRPDRPGLVGPAYENDRCTSVDQAGQPDPGGARFHLGADGPGQVGRHPLGGQGPFIAKCRMTAVMGGHLRRGSIWPTDHLGSSNERAG